MCHKPVFILGAGATKECGGPLTGEIIPAAFRGEFPVAGRLDPVGEREDMLRFGMKFLAESFHIETDHEVQQEDCPSLSWVLSMLGRSAESGQPIGDYVGDELVKAKRAIEYAIFAVIETALRQIPSEKRYHDDLLRPLYAHGIEPCVISLNYDVVVDNAMFALAEKRPEPKPPDYGVEYATELYDKFSKHGTFGRLFKLHGSLNWLYCENCERLDLFVSDALQTGLALDELYDKVPFDDAYSCRGTPCRGGCGGFVSPILITPTYVKAYDNKHIKRTWEQAERAMREADRAVIIGYSLPTDDVEIAMLLKRGLDHLSRESITVVQHAEGPAVPIGQHEAGRRYRSLFGAGIDWHTCGFAGWLDRQRASRAFPFAHD